MLFVVVPKKLKDVTHAEKKGQVSPRYSPLGLLNSGTAAILALELFKSKRTLAKF